ncbi:hypothetical protein P4C99_12330 [Pontiellaceae bacterium B1224]|nr:hypothetical protein [Pontiellaceae bacterium B1224]
MKKIMSTLFVLVLAGGLHAFAEDVAEPATKETTAVKSKRTTSKPKADIRDNFFYGGYINLSFGSYTVIGIEPMIGYKVTPKFAAGIKLQYNYIQDDRYANRSYTTSTYGGSVFGRYLVTPKFYAQVEAATYNYESFYLNGSSEREWVPFVFMGGGLIQPLSERTWVNVQILFDVWQDDSSPYDDWQPFFSIGVGAGF